MFILTPWIIACAGFSAMSNMDILLRILLRPWGSFSVSGAFGGVSEVVGEFFWLFPHDLDRLSHPISMGYLLLSTGCRPSDFSSGGAFVAIACTSFPCDDRGSEVLGSDWFATPREFISLTYVSSSRDGQGFDGMLTLSPTVFLK